MNRHRRAIGISLADLLVGSVLLCVFMLAFAKVFRATSVGLAGTDQKSLALSLAQSRLGTLKNSAYHSIMVTQTPVALPWGGGFHDPAQYPPALTRARNTNFTTYAWVERMALDPNTENMVSAAPTDPETGFKRLRVATLWEAGSDKHHLEINHILRASEKSTVGLVIQGTVRSPAGTPVEGARIIFSDQLSTKSLTPQNNYLIHTNTNFLPTDRFGAYSNVVHAGTHSFVVQSAGHDPYVSSDIVINPLNSPVTHDVTLSTTSRGSIEGAVWYSSAPVISRVVAATANAAGFLQEYVEIFNPSTFTWTVSGANGLGLRYQANPGLDPWPDPIVITYNTNNVTAGRYYLFANTSPVVVAGQSRTPNALWTTTAGNANETRFPLFLAQQRVIQAAGDAWGAAGSLQLFRTNGGAVVDTLGWNAGAVPGLKEGSPLPDADGFQPGECYARLSSTSGVSSTLGPAYDANDNAVDWASLTPAPAPRTTATAVPAIVAGIPAVGAWVAALQSHTWPVQAQWSATTPPYARYEITSVPQGHYSLLGFLGNFGSAMAGNAPGTNLPDSVVISPGQTGRVDLRLSVQNYYSVVEGHVRNSFAVGIPNVPAGESLALTDTWGEFRGIGSGFNSQGYVHSGYGSGTLSLTGVTPGSVVSGQTVFLKALGIVRGFVGYDATQPAYNIGVTARRQSDSESFGVVSNNQGLWQLQLEEGNYQAYAQRPNGYVAVPETQSLQIRSDEAGKVFDMAPIILVKNETGATGKILVNGQPAPGGTVVAAMRKDWYPAGLAPGGTPPASVPTASNGPDGAYYMPLTPLAQGYNLYAFRTRVENGLAVTQRADAMDIIVSTTTGMTPVDFSFPW